MSRLEELHSFLKENPSDPFLKFAIGQEHLKAGELEKSREVLENLIKEHPDYVASYYHLGKILEKMDQKDLVQSMYEEGIKVAQRVGDGHTQGELMQALADFQGNN